ncbi:STAS/SEC14 domain-containing protein [Sphingomonas sp. HITSZ_GF]|uniref:STAS/SEC14 domain-containing protein n=1 Tax=Sphingomonas sp. HITSZ_GF TaxID=3037247 RepID=UPI00240D0A21|nr:STAS/SEC14 domain-containing protein [Sphingomonas sp. HITSZ_GF]MDG2535497.1 STAS/SEC14 domain-containing protein [Sphingomonas sp. HITSZ_GF]
MYRVAFRKELNLLDIEWLAMFEPDRVGDYARKLRDQFDAEGFAPGYLLRMDMRRSGVQGQEALQAFRRHFAGFPVASRIAVVTESAVARMQIRREMTQPYMQIFDRAESALTWLLGRGGAGN